MELLSPEWLVILPAVALLAGFIDAVAGGGGLLTVPALLMSGMSPAQALATNKLQGTFGTLSAVVTFFRAGHLPLRRLWPAVVTIAIGAGLGAWAAQVVTAALLDQVIPVLLIAIAAYYLFSPAAGQAESRQRVSAPVFNSTAAPAIGFYDGFFGPGTGAFFSTGNVVLRGHNLLTATAHAKLFNFTSNIASLVVFIAGGQTLWLAGLLMGAGQIAGALIGSRMVVKRGAGLVRPMLIVMSLLITANLVIRNPDHFLHQAVLALFNS
ncbi:TSUP family transporter [Granulosicoccaceae sp. 1_MG-2023]|nr:TSUP family transporter [Granulosicoccaceae sp. 1_MG-2023]